MTSVDLQRATTRAPSRARGRIENATEILTRGVGYAVLAPSERNSQPWRFRIDDGALELSADRTRALPVIDPDRRELVISCGAALQNVRIALRHFGYAADVQLFPDPARPDLLARVQPTGRRPPSRLNEMLFTAIPKRHTNRARYQSRPVSPRIRSALQQGAELDGAWLSIATDAKRRSAVADLVAEADRVQGASAAVRREFAAWLRPNADPAPDGIPGYALGITDPLSRVAPTLMRHAPWGPVQARRDRDLVLAAPLIAVLGTPGDTPRDWLAAGQALQRVLLIATTQGVSAAFLNQVTEVPPLRGRLRALVGAAGEPQLIMRMGYGPAAKPTPRRAVPEVLDSADVT